MKIKIKYISALLIVGASFIENSFSQSDHNLQFYKAIVNYIRRDTVFNNNFGSGKYKKKRIDVSTYLIPSNFKSVTGTDLSLLSMNKLDSLNDSLEETDNAANANYEPTSVSHLSTLSTTVNNNNYLLYFSKPYKGLVYCELFPFVNKKSDKGSPYETYRKEYMGKVVTYMFTISKGKIVNIKKGVYYMQ